MKGNHNARRKRWIFDTIVFNKSKIQNERKSQHCDVACYPPINCVQQVKDTK